MAKSALDALKGEIAYFRPAVWTAGATNFSKLLTGPPAFVIYTSPTSMPKAPGDSLNWAISLTRCLQSEPAFCDTLAPFRIGPVATDSCETMLSILYAGLAGVEMSKLSVRAKTVPEMMRDVGVAWRCLDAAGEWPYDSALRPPQLDPAFRDWVISAAALLTYHHLESAAPQTEKLSRRRILTLFLLGQVGSPRIRAWAESRRQSEITRHWATYHTDPRTINEEAPGSDDERRKKAYAVVRVLVEGERARPTGAVEQLLDEGPILTDHKIRQQTLAVGREGFVRPPLIGQSELVAYALPTTLLQGDPPRPKISLDGATPLSEGTYQLNPGRGAPVPASHKDLRPASRPWWPSSPRTASSSPPQLPMAAAAVATGLAAPTASTAAGAAGAVRTKQSWWRWKGSAAAAPAAAAPGQLDMNALI